MCSGILCWNKNSFQSLGRSNYQCSQCTYTCQVCKSPFKEETISYLLKCGQGILLLKRLKNQFKILLEMSVVRQVDVQDKKCVYVQTWRKIMKVVTNVSNAERRNMKKRVLQWRNMIFSVSNEVIDWSLDFGPDSVTLFVDHLVQEMTVSSQENPLADWSLFFYQRQEFLNNNLARVPVTPNQEGFMERRKKVLSSVGAQGIDTSWYQVSDVDNVEFYWEKDQLDVDVVFRPCRKTPFSPFNIQRFWDGFNGLKSDSNWRRAGQAELSSS